MSIQQFRSTDAIDLRVTIIKRAKGGGFTTLTPTIKIVDAAGTDVTPANPADELTAVNASVLPGRYKYSLAAGTLTAGQKFDVQINPKNNFAVAPPTFQFEILTGITIIAPPSGDDLTTLANVNALVGDTDSAQDTLINSLIGRTSSFIQTFCHRKFNEQAITEKHDGDGGDILFLRNPPIQSLTTVTVDSVSKTTTLFEIADGDNSGMISSETVAFTAGRNKVTVVYQGGFSTLPGEIVGLATKRVAIEFGIINRGKIGLTGEQAPDGSRTFISDNFTQKEKDILFPYILRWTTMAVS